VDLVGNNLLLTNQLEKNTFAMDGDRQAVKDGHSRTSLLLNNVVVMCDDPLRDVCVYFLMLCISCVMNYCMWPFSVTEPFILFDVLNYVLYAVSFLRLAGMRACPRVIHARG